MTITFTGPDAIYGPDAVTKGADVAIEYFVAR
jgi:hypothetical protein